MALVVADRVQQTGTANTTVSFTLSGSVTGFQSFSVIGNTNTTYYAATDGSGNWEVGVGTYSTTGPTLTRTTVLASSNSGSAVTFSGTVNVFVTYPASYSATTQSPSFTTPALGTPSSGTLSNCTVDGTNSVGYLTIPQSGSSGTFTLALSDSGKHIYAASGAAASTVTIPAASVVAFPIGTTITFVNLSVNAMSIAITTDTMYLSPSGLTGTRTLAQYGVASATKVSGVSSSGIWIISGTGLT